MASRRPKPNEAQRQAIRQTEGRVLIIAGPGTGKTRTLTERVVFLIAEKKVDPSAITVTTFTRRAADELLSRVLSALDARHMAVDAGTLTIGNFHQLGREILALQPETSPWRPGARTLDVLSRDALLVRLVPQFRRLSAAIDFVPQLRTDPANAARYLGSFFDRLREGFYDLSQDDAPTRAACRMLSLYRQFLLHNNVLDYSEILYAACERLEREPAVREAAQARCRYLMVDEYQDTNRVQERMIRLLSEAYGNLCVVGDDDQSLYRFRGATVDNLLGFARRYEDVHVIRLSENYRSDGAILDEATQKLEQAVAAQESAEPLRLSKSLVPAAREHVHEEAVQRLYVEDEETWAARVTETILRLHAEGVPYHEMAFLSHSVQPVNERAALYRALREAGVPLSLSPIANLMRAKSVDRFTALLYLALEEPLEMAVRRGSVEAPFLSRYRKEAAALPIAGRDERAAALAAFHHAMDAGVTLPFLTFCHELLGTPPFQTLALEALDGAVRAREQWEALTFFIRTADALLRETPTADPLRTADCSVFEGDLVTASAALFGWALPFLEAKKPRPGKDEVVLQEETLPVMTIHQSKGLEFSVVILLETPFRKPWAPRPTGIDTLTPATSQEPVDATVAAAMDHARLHYTARTRARTLLVETAVRAGYDDPAPSEASLGRLTFTHQTSAPAVRRISYTADLARYEACPRQYYFLREAGLSAPPESAEARGTLLHETLSLLHHRLMKAPYDAPDAVNEEALRELLQRVYGGLRKARFPLTPEAGQSAWAALLRYAHAAPWRQWGGIRAVEMDVQVARGDALLEGTLDLLGADGTIVDFKTGRRTPEKTRQYREQLALYRALLSHHGGEAKAANILYYIDEDVVEDVRLTSEERDAFERKVRTLVDGILAGDVERMTDDVAQCEGCPAQWICGRHETF
ncbi:MAG: ATP-dependent DNA helicase [Peptoniphilaceae bacterium]|nr:ATP-dependent DNA helicase [Peptoniphilaceae bacterium]